LREILETAIIKLKIIRGGRHEKIIFNFLSSLSCKWACFRPTDQLTIGWNTSSIEVDAGVSGQQVFVVLKWEDRCPNSGDMELPD
jgi:hypothetical protein